MTVELEDRVDGEDIKRRLNGSPFYTWSGLKVVELGESSSRVELEVRPEHKNIYGVVHGGVLSSVLDASCGSAALTVMKEGEAPMTLDLKVQFYKSVEKGKLTARAEVVKRTGRFAIVESSLFDEDGEMVARGGTIHSVLRRK